MLIQRIKQTNFLSFGPDTSELDLKPLNVLIGPNGSGKSNLLEGIALLQAAPQDLTAPIREGGGIREWIWRGEPKASTAHIEVILENSQGPQALRYRMGFVELGQRFELISEMLENERPHVGHAKPYLYYEQTNGRATLNYRPTDTATREQRQLQPKDIKLDQSILAQRKDPHHFPELTEAGRALSSIRFYREWSFGRDALLRKPQNTDLPNDFLLEDGKNLGLVLNRLRREPQVKKRLLVALSTLYGDITDFDISVEGGTVQVFLQEGDIMVPATRLSDGTLRYLCLLAILCHPTPPPLVCIEEPELGLHPDILPILSELLLDASDRGQLIVTTHSEVLVDALTDTPENIVICEKHDGRTKMRRLVKDDLVNWLERYSLGELWRRGELGGNRW